MIVPCVKEHLELFGNVLVMDLLGPDLYDLFTDVCKRKFTLKTVLMLAEQMIETIEFIHSKGYVHDDLKPDNIWMGIGNDKNRLFIGDYGLARKITDKHGTKLAYRQVLLKKTCFHFQNGFWNELSFSKCGSFSKSVFIPKM